MATQYGGPATAMPLLAQGLSALGLKVDIATLRDAAEKPVVADGQWQYTDHSRRIAFPSQGTPYRISTALASWLTKHATDYDLIHGHAVLTHSSASAMRAAKRANVPYIVRPLGILNRWGMQAKRRWLKQILMRWVDGPLLRHASAIHVTSLQEQGEIERYGFGIPILLLPLGLDLTAPPDPGQALSFLSQFPEAKGDPSVLFLSRIHPKKGIELLMNAFASLRSAHPRARLIIAGEGEAVYESQLHSHAASLGITEAVTWTGFIDGAAKQAAFAAADIFCLTSFSENFGMALLEAMAAGRPCLSSDQVALGAEAAAANAVACCRCDQDSVTSALMRLAAMTPAERQALGQKGRDYAVHHHSIQTVGERLLQVYHDTIYGSTEAT